MLRQFNCRLDDRTFDLIERIRTEHACTQAQVVKQAVRLLARREGVKPAQEKTKK